MRRLCHARLAGPGTDDGRAVIFLVVRQGSERERLVCSLSGAHGGEGCAGAKRGTHARHARAARAASYRVAVAANLDLEVVKRSAVGGEEQHVEDGAPRVLVVVVEAPGARGRDAADALEHAADGSRIDGDAGGGRRLWRRRRRAWFGEGRGIKHSKCHCE